MACLCLAAAMVMMQTSLIMHRVITPLAQEGPREVLGSTATRPPAQEPWLGE